MRRVRFASAESLRAATLLLVSLALPIGAWSQIAAANSTLTQAATRAMAKRSGTVVVIDVATGNVLAAYHPEAAARRVALPGSAIKPFSLLALLESGKVNAQTTLMCNRSLTVARHKLDCTHPNLKQPFDAATALAYSCNTYFTRMATRLTPSELRSSFLNDGFGSPSGLVPDEVAGTVALASTQAELQLQAIGEWGVRLTPLELLRGYQHIAHMSLQHDAKLAPLFDGLEGSVSYGMGHFAQPASSVKVAGKTGTSLVEEGAWRHGWFAGYAPANEPEIALVVFLETGHGPTDAASVAREIFAAYAENRRSAR